MIRRHQIKDCYVYYNPENPDRVFIGDDDWIYEGPAASVIKAIWLLRDRDHDYSKDDIVSP